VPAFVRYCLKAVILGVVLAANAQDAPDLESSLRSLGDDYANLISFSAEPRIAAAAFSVDPEEPGNTDNDVRTVKVPLHREFDIQGSDLRWFAEATLSYLRYEQELALAAGDALAFGASPRWTAYSGMLQSGLVIPLGAGFSFVPTIGVGASRLENKMSFSEPAVEDALRPLLDGVLYNWETNAVVSKADVGVRYKNDFGRWNIRGKAHLIYGYVDSFNESSLFRPFSNGGTTLSATVDIKYPLPFSVKDEPLSIIGTLSNVSFLDSNRSSLGFENLYEAGLSIGYRRYAIGLLGVFGPDVSGLTISFDYGY